MINFNLGLQGTIWLLSIVSIIVYIYHFIKKKQSFWENKGIKYVKPKFLLGSMELFPSKPFSEKIQEIYNHFPEERYHGAYQFTLPVLVIKDPDLIKQITIKNFNHFVNHREFASTENDAFWSRNLVASRDERWKHLRSTLSPSFTSNKMKLMYGLIQDCARKFVEHFQNKGSELIEIEMKDTMRRFTTDVIATTAFGLEVNSFKDRNNDFLRMGQEVTNFGGLAILKFFLYGASPTLFKLFKIKVIPTKIANFFSNMIEETVRTRKENKIVRLDMIHLLMEAQKEDTYTDKGLSSVEESNFSRSKQKHEITIEDICSQAFIFFLGGFESVSITLTFACYELAVDSEVQNRLRKEIKSMSGEISYETLLSLKYLDMVVSEVLRKWPTGILTDRQVSKDFIIEPKKLGEKPLHLKRGDLCWFPMIAYHHDEKFFPNPSKFDPERFSDENKHNINSSIYMPFGAGPRNCIGLRFALLEIKLLLVYILKNFEIVPIKKTPIPMVLDKNVGALTAKGGMWLGLKQLCK